MTVVEPQIHSGGTLEHVIDNGPHDGTSVFISASGLQPASVGSDGTVMVEWELTEEEQERLFMGGRLRLWLRLPPEIKVIPVMLEALACEDN